MLTFQALQSYYIIREAKSLRKAYVKSLPPLGDILINYGESLNFSKTQNLENLLYDVNVLSPHMRPVGITGTYLRGPPSPLYVCNIIEFSCQV